MTGRCQTLSELHAGGFGHPMLKHSQLFYEGDRLARVDFGVRAGQIYADLKPMYDFFTRNLLQKIKEVGLGGHRRHPRRTPTVVGSTR